MAEICSWYDIVYYKYGCVIDCYSFHRCSTVVLIYTTGMTHLKIKSKNINLNKQNVWYKCMQLDAEGFWNVQKDLCTSVYIQRKQRILLAIYLLLPIHNLNWFFLNFCNSVCWQFTRSHNVSDDITYIITARLLKPNEYNSLVSELLNIIQKTPPPFLTARTLPQKTCWIYQVSKQYWCRNITKKTKYHKLHPQCKRSLLFSYWPEKDKYDIQR